MSVSADDIAVTLARSTPSSAESDAWEQWITDARLIIGTRLGDLDALDQDVLDYVVREAVAAKARNPEGKKSETIDDYSYALPDGGRVNILDAWWDMLSPGSDAGAFSVRPSFEVDTAMWSRVGVDGYYCGDDPTLGPGWR